MPHEAAFSGLFPKLLLYSLTKFGEKCGPVLTGSAWLPIRRGGQLQNVTGNQPQSTY